MSFGTSPSDVDTVVAFCKALYRKCRDAGGEYDEISQEVRGLHTVLKHLKYELEAPDSPVNKERSAWSRQLSPLVGDCDYTLRELDDLLKKDNRFSSSPTSARGDIERRGSSLDTLALIRVKLLNHKSKLTKFLDSIQLDQCQGKPEELDNSDGHLDDILDKVDIIAARIQSRNERSSAKRDDDDKEVWKQFRKELIAEGFSSQVLEHHRDVLRAYIREIDQKGLLDEAPSSSGPTPTASKGAERWLESVKTTRPHDKPPTFSSLDLPTEDASAKAVPAREENVKFPQSMKLDLRQPPPEVRGDGEYPLTKTISFSSRQRRTSGNSHRLPPQVPRLITSNENDEKAVQYFNTDSSSNEDSDHEHRRRSNKSQLGEVIKTTELIAYSQALQLHPNSPSSFRSTQDYFGADASPRALSYQPKKQIEYGTSPIQAGAIPIPQPNPRSSNSSFSAPSRSATFRLAPDQNGKEIPHDAKWTKINRRLVSPEVLDQDHLRYEARPEFVAVLGILSRAEIESLAERSRILRDARHRRSLPTQAPPPAQPPRPIPIPAPINHRHRSGRDTPSSSESDSDSSDSGHGRRRKSKGRKGYAGSNVGAPVSGYPNPYGQPLPSPVRSPGNREFKDRKEKDYDRERDHDRDRDREWKSKDKDHDRDHDRDRDRDGSRHRRRKSRSRDRRDSHRDRDRDRDGGRGGGSYQKSSRWKETLTAAGIGGAAVSLLNVLSEAAEGL